MKPKTMRIDQRMKKAKSTINEIYKSNKRKETESYLAKSYKKRIA